MRHRLVAVIASAMLALAFAGTAFAAGSPGCSGFGAVTAAIAPGGALGALVSSVAPTGAGVVSGIVQGEHADFCAAH